MLRITAILSLTFYLIISVGVHVNVDTCCKSLAGLSIFSLSETDHAQPEVMDCCMTAETPACHPMTEGAESNSCPSESVYVQVLLDTPPPAVVSATLSPAISDLPEILFASNVISTQAIDEIPEAYTSPPAIALDDDLYLTIGSFLTYG